MECAHNSRCGHSAGSRPRHITAPSASSVRGFDRVSIPTATRELLESTFLDVDADLADHIMRVIESTDRDALLAWCEPAQDRERECFTPAGLMDLQAHALNSMLGCHGIQQIGDNDEPHKLADYDYLDPGDLDAMTLVRDNSRGANGTWLVTSVGDVRELVESTTMIPADCAELIQRLALTIDAAAGRPPGCYRGSSLESDEHPESAECPDMGTASTFVHREGWTNDRHRAIYVSESELAVFTFCEGDIALQVCPTREGFDTLLRSCARCYER